MSTTLLLGELLGGRALVTVVDTVRVAGLVRAVSLARFFCLAGSSETGRGGGVLGFGDSVLCSSLSTVFLRLLLMCSFPVRALDGEGERLATDLRCGGLV